MPTTKLGKWSVGLHIFFLIVIIVSVFFVKVVGALSFDNHWWDITAAIMFPTSIAAFIVGIIAKRKYQDSSTPVLLSILLGAGVILFILLHSLFIQD